MGALNPIKLVGNWEGGYALDHHMVSSEFLGTDEWGHNQFNNTRSDIGQLLYELKYQQDHSKIQEIMKLITPFLKEWKISNKIDCIIPIPSSNKSRELQPVLEISQQISKIFHRPIFFDVIQKNSSTQSKNIGGDKRSDIIGTISKNKPAKWKVDILLIDDLYDSGVTLSETVRILKTDPYIESIYVLTMTKTRR